MEDTNESNGLGLNQRMKFSELPESVKYKFFYQHNINLMQREKVLQAKIKDLEAEIRAKNLRLYALEKTGVADLIQKVSDQAEIIHNFRVVKSTTLKKEKKIMRRFIVERNLVFDFVYYRHCILRNMEL